MPGLTHWNSPTFFAYFSICASGPGVLADFLSSALNQQAMLWRTSPAATELEAVTLGWLRQLIGLPGTFEGVIYDTASISTLHALTAARERALRGVRRTGLAGRDDARGLRVYCSDQAHSSVEKAVILLGLGHESVVKVPSDAAFRMDVAALASTISADRAAGKRPLAVIATTGTTSTTSVDPVDAIADVCEREGVWLHVDAAYGGAAAMVPGMDWVLAGAERADSLVVNPHKWMLTPFDLSVLFCRDMDVLREAFSLVPEYLTTSEAPEVRNLMDTGVQLGRRFRALKLWFVLRYFGAEGMRSRIAEHLRLARVFAAWVDEIARLRAAGARSDERGLLPRVSGIATRRARRTGCPERAPAARTQRKRQDLPVAHQASRRLRAAGRDRSRSHHRGAPCGSVAADRDTAAHT